VAVSAARALLAPPFVAAVLVVGVPYWTAPYDRLGSGGWPFALLGIGAAALAAYTARAPGSLAGTGAGATAFAVALRVLVDVVRDPTSHNLWPLELGMMVGAGAAAAFVGGLAGAALRRMLGMR
jgi:hypothetical protein